MMGRMKPKTVVLEPGESLVVVVRNFAFEHRVYVYEVDCERQGSPSVLALIGGEAPSLRRFLCRRAGELADGKKKAEVKIEGFHFCEKKLCPLQGVLFGYVPKRSWEEDARAER